MKSIKTTEQNLLSILLGIKRIPIVDILDHMVILFSIFWGTVLPLPTVLLPFCILTNKAVFQSPHMFTIIFSCSLVFILMYIRQCCDFICIFPMFTDSEQHFMCLIIKFFAHLYWISSCKTAWTFYIFRIISPFSETWFINDFAHYWLPFHLSILSFGALKFLKLR